MKKGESGLTMLISIIVIIIILIQYLIFFVFFPSRTITVNEYKAPGEDLLLINFARLNSDLIVKSVNEGSYVNLEKEIQSINIKKCFEIKIKEKAFSNCDIKNPEMSIINIPDYSNNQIKITLITEKK